MKKVIVLAIVLIPMILPSSVLSQEQTKFEFNIGGVGYFNGEGISVIPLPVFSFAVHNRTKTLGVELNVLGWLPFSLNVILSPKSIQSNGIVPYVTGGAWTLAFQGFGMNVGGGVRFFLSKKSAIRIEYRYFFADSLGYGSSILAAGISTYF